MASSLLTLRGGWGPGLTNHNHKNMGTKSKKRAYDPDDTDENGFCCQVSTWSKFLVATCSNQDQKLTNPILVSKAIQGIASSVKNVTFMCSGDVLIECATRTQSTNLQQAHTFGNISVDIKPHKSFNSKHENISRI